MTARRAWSGAATLVALAAASACSFFGPDPDHLDASFGATTPPAPKPTRACTPARPAPAKTGPDPAGTDRTFAAVISTMALLPAGDPRAFDLDDSCTCPEPPSCRGNASRSACDGDRGTDNTLSGILKDLPGAELLVDPERLRQRLAQGESTLIVYVTRYNGTDDDSDVDVYLIRSTGTAKTDGVAATPRFDGTDPYDCVIDDVAVCKTAAGVSSIVPSISPQHGYVRDGNLVVPDARFFLSVVAGYPIRGRGVLTAKIEAFSTGAGGEPRYALKEGIMAGGLPLGDLLMALALVEPFPGTTLCAEKSVMGTFKSQLCAGRDMTFAPSPRVTTGEPEVSCDAISAVVTFDAVPFQAHEAIALPPATPCSAAELVTCE